MTLNKKQQLSVGDFYYSDKTGSSTLDASKTCIGICVIPSNFLPDEKARIMSLKEMDYNNPENGSLQHVGMCWGQSGVDTPIKNQTTFTTIDIEAIGSYEGTTIGSKCYGYLPTNRIDDSWKPGMENKVDKGTNWNGYVNVYVPSPYMIVNGKEVLCPQYNSNATSDFNGKSNTEILTKLHTAEDWKTVDKITNNGEPNYSPAAVCCARYHTEGTNSGDWYLPSIGELGFIMPRFNGIQNSLKALGERVVLPLDNDEYCYWSSSEYGGCNAFIMFANYSGFGYRHKNYGYPYVRAFLMA